MTRGLKLVAIAVTISMVFLVACSGVDGDKPSHEPFVPEYGPDEFVGYPGYFYPESGTELGNVDTIDQLFDQFFQAMIALDPQLTTARRFPPAIVPSQEDKLTPVSFGYQAWKIKLARNTLSKLESFSDEGLTDEQRVNKDILRWNLEQMIDGERFLYHDVLNLDAVLKLFVFMSMTHKIEDREDAENYLARLKEIPVVFDQLLVNLKIQEEIAYIPPKRVLTNALQRVDFIPNNLLGDFNTKVENLPDKDQLILECQGVIDDIVKPASSRLRLQIQGMLDQTVDNVSQMPGGKDYYAWLLKDYTTSSMPPAVVHQICKDEVERLQKEIREVLEDLGYDSTNYFSAINTLSADTIPPDQLLEEYQRLIEMAEGFLPRLFGKLPQTPVEIHFNQVRVGYDIPTRDGSLPGVFLANPQFSQPMIGAKWFVWHETIPGHHMQMAIEHEANVHYFRDLFFLSGYIEGWGTYGEMLPFEFELDDDKASYLSSLNRYLMLCARVVIDTGLNYMDWSEQEAGQYFRDVTGLSPDPWITDVVTRPGRSAAYYIGMYQIRELREEARKELGAKFNIRDFHDLVLQHGSLPLDVLEDIVEEYIAANK